MADLIFTKYGKYSSLEAYELDNALMSFSGMEKVDDTYFFTGSDKDLAKIKKIINAMKWLKKIKKVPSTPPAIYISEPIITSEDISLFRPGNLSF